MLYIPGFVQNPVMCAYSDGLWINVISTSPFTNDIVASIMIGVTVPQEH